MRVLAHTTQHTPNRYDSYNKKKKQTFRDHKHKTEKEVVFLNHKNVWFLMLCG